MPLIYSRIVQLYMKKYKVHKLVKEVRERSKQTNNEAQSAVNKEKINEDIVYFYIASEKSKPATETTILDEYMLKVLLFGYVMLFACSFYLGPLILLIIFAIDLRVDGLRSLWLYRRPVGYRAQDIGSWLNIIKFLNAVGIINNAFLIAFVSSWSKSDILEDSTQNRLIFVVAFEHVVFFLWLFIVILFPKVSESVETKIRLVGFSFFYTLLLFW